MEKLRYRLCSSETGKAKGNHEQQADWIARHEAVTKARAEVARRWTESSK